MDQYCIDRGTLLDNPSVRTLEAPERHSVHCLVDVGRCRNSAFWLLGAKAAGSRDHSRLFALDATGHDAIVDLAREVGSRSAGCSTCTGQGTLRSGFQATVAGRLTNGVLQTAAVAKSTVSCASLLASLPSEEAAPPPPSPPPPSPPPPGCTPSTDTRYECMVRPAAAPSGFTLHWRVVDGTASATSSANSSELGPSKLVAANSYVAMLATATASVGWIGVGFAPSHGQMLGGDAVIGWLGASVAPALYSLTSYSVGGIQPLNGELTASSIAMVDGVVQMAFTRPLASSQLSRHLSEAPAGGEGGNVPLSAEGTTNLLFAIGPQALLSYHGSNKGFTRIVLGGGTASSAGLTERQRAKVAHGILMLLSWAFFLPAGVLIALNMRHRRPLWLHLHMGCNLAGLVLALTGLILVLDRLQPLGGSFASDEEVAHGVLGLLAMGAGLVQPINGFLRPHKKEHGPQTRGRRLWEVAHRVTGWLAILTATANVHLGIDILAQQEQIALPHAQRDYYIGFGFSVVSLLSLVVIARCVPPSHPPTDDAVATPTTVSSTMEMGTKEVPSC